MTHGFGEPPIPLVESVKDQHLLKPPPSMESSKSLSHNSICKLASLGKYTILTITLIFLSLRFWKTCIRWWCKSPTKRKTAAKLWRWLESSLFQGTAFYGTYYLVLNYVVSKSHNMITWDFIIFYVFRGFCGGMLPIWQHQTKKCFLGDETEGQVWLRLWRDHQVCINVYQYWVFVWCWNYTRQEVLRFIFPHSLQSTYSFTFYT